MMFKKRFEKFVNNQMSAAEKRKFLNDLEQKKDLKESFQFYKLELYLGNELPSPLLAEFQKELDESEFLRRQVFTLKLEKYFNNELSSDEEQNIINSILEDTDLKEDFDTYRIDLYYSGELKGAHLQLLKEELAYDKGLQDKLEFYSMLGNALNYQEKESVDNEKEFIETIQDVLEAYEQEEKQKSGWQKAKEELDALSELEEYEIRSYISEDNYVEPENHFRILQEIKQKREKYEQELFLQGIAEGRFVKISKRGHGYSFGKSDVKDEVKADLDNFNKPIWTKNKQSARKSRKPEKHLVLSAAAVIAVLLAIVLIVPFKNRNDRLYDKYYSQEQQLLDYSATKREDMFEKAMECFQEGKFDEAVILFENLESNYYTSSLYYMGKSYMELKQYDMAIQQFNRIIDAGDIVYLADAQWNAALCYIKTDQIDKAKVYLEIIIENKSQKYAQKAKDLLKKL